MHLSHPLPLREQGEVSSESQQLVDITQQSLENAISICRPGVPWRRIGATVQDLSDQHGYGSVAEFCGHGIGQDFHMLPFIHHCINSEPGEMQAGNIFTIEPILTAGSPHYRILDDGWTAVSVDGGWSAQFEHTVLITPDGHEVLT